MDAAEIPLPATPTRAERAPLGEISGNTQQEPDILLEVNFGKAPKESNEKKRTARAAKKTKKGPTKKENKEPEVVEDECQSSASSAVAEACQQLSRHGSESEYLDPSAVATGS